MAQLLLHVWVRINIDKQPLLNIMLTRICFFFFFFFGDLQDELKRLLNWSSLLTWMHAWMCLLKITSRLHVFKVSEAAKHSSKGGVVVFFFVFFFHCLLQHALWCPLKMLAWFCGWGGDLFIWRGGKVFEGGEMNRRWKQCCVSKLLIKKINVFVFNLIDEMKCPPQLEFFLNKGKNYTLYMSCY